jgi:hypothetical protein
MVPCNGETQPEAERRMLQLLEAIHRIPFWMRAMALVCAFVIVGAVELALRRKRAERWKEYAAWVAFAASGATFGAANDLITSALSPAYFVIGKGLSQGPQLAWAAADLGARAGTAAGLLIGGILLMANNPRKGMAPLPYRWLARVGLVPLAMAAIGAPLIALGSTFDLQGLGPELARVLPESEARTFLLVQRAHLGAYAGALVGTVCAAFLVRRIRLARSRANSSETPD